MKINKIRRKCHFWTKIEVKMTHCVCVLFVDNLSFPSMLLESQISSQPLAKHLILNFLNQSFLSRDVYDRVLGRDVIDGRSKLTSQ